MTSTVDLISALTVTAPPAPAPLGQSQLRDGLSAEKPALQESVVQEPEEELIFTARRKITLQCGQSSITLHPNGKIILRGEYILSAAQGTNRIVGGQIEIN